MVSHKELERNETGPGILKHRKRNIIWRGGDRKGNSSFIFVPWKKSSRRFACQIFLKYCEKKSEKKRKKFFHLDSEI